MTDKSFCIVVSGLPASGKTTVGKMLSKQIDIPYLDKDDYLERLFGCRECGDHAKRRELSLESNVLFQNDAEKMDQVILISHWRPMTMTEILVHRLHG